jgi:hypothetical protein
MEGSSGLRVSDQQRERAAEQLRDHFAAGRLSEDELSERVRAAYTARTDEQLQALLVDLPRLPATPQQLKAELAERRSHLQRRLLQETGGGLAAFVVCVVIWAASGTHRGSFWPIWVALVVLIPLLRNGWRLYGPAPQLDRVERELEARGRRGARHHRRRGGWSGRG